MCWDIKNLPHVEDKHQYKLKYTRVYIIQGRSAYFTANSVNRVEQFNWKVWIFQTFFIFILLIPSISRCYSCFIALNDETLK